jgi:putative exosortase-associated protein (TIGR04073 family)
MRLGGMMAAVALGLFAGGCAGSGSARTEKGPNRDDWSLTGTGRELGRGLTNVGLCWLEIPHRMEDAVRDQKISDPVDAGSAVFHGMLGAVHGALRTAGRAVGGVLEIVLSPFPPYGPINSPPYPPYLNPAPERTAPRAPAPEPD